MTVERMNELGRRLMETLVLRYSPIALKLIYSEDEIPEGTLRPFRDRGDRLSMCQAFAMTRRNRTTLAMLKEDHWCVWPLVSYRLVELDEDDYDYMGTKLMMKDTERSKQFLRQEYPILQGRPPLGFLLGPLESAPFVPDIICVYCRPGQIRSIMMAQKFQTGEPIAASLEPLDSCVHSTIPVLNGKPYNVTFPDPGEYERGMAGEDEVMFTLRAERLPELLEGMDSLGAFGQGYKDLAMDMPTNFPRPEFYNKMFAKWGLATGPEWRKRK